MEMEVNEGVSGHASRNIDLGRNSEKEMLHLDAVANCDRMASNGLPGWHFKNQIFPAKPEKLAWLRNIDSLM